MAEGNGGNITVGERLRRIEDRLDSIEEHLDQRITRHKEANDAAVKELASSVIKDFGNRVAALETKDVADEASQKALVAAKQEARSNKRWVIGSAISLGVLLIAAIGILLQLLGKVG